MEKWPLQAEIYGTTAHMAGDVEWAEVYDPSWQPEFTEHRIGTVVRLTGNCPRCNHPTAMDFDRLIPGIPGEIVKGDEEVVTMCCKCGHRHEGHPADDSSCGAYWATVATL